jgi:O-acetylhomoserine (thiol)-lyase
MSSSEWGFDTLQIHAGQTPDSATGSRAVPIYQTTSYVYESAEDAAALFALQKPGYIYTRINNPTVAVLEDRLTALEKGAGAMAFASGMAAITAAVQCVCGPGDEIVSASTLYGGTHTLFSARLLPRFGVTAHLVDPDDLAAIEAAINSKTKLVYIETIGNPNINIPDIEAIAAIAHRHGLPLVADNTFGTPYLIRCRDHGVDIVVHSLTKYIGGHGTSVGGAIVDLGTFDWHNPRFPEFTQPDATYHGIVYADVPAPFATKARIQLMRDFGACISPFNAFLILQGLETLSLRLDRHCRNALAAAAFLKNHPAVKWVHFPLLEGDPYHARALRYFPKGAGAILSFGVKGGLQAGRKLINALKLFSLLANVADVRSLVIHPASTTHSQLTEDELKAAGVAPEMLRLSIGLEDEKDILGDLDQALRASQKEE